MELVEDLVSRADELFSLGETENEIEKLVSKFRDGIVNLLKALLAYHQQDVDESFSQLVKACLNVEPDLVEIEMELQMFAPGIELAGVDKEELIDSANEICDWVIDVLDQTE